MRCKARSSSAFDLGAALDRGARWTATAALVLSAGFLASCSPSEAPQTGSQTNWLRLCDNSDDCGDLSCVCEVCTVVCDAEAICEADERGSCVLPGEQGAIAVCGGSQPQVGLCLPRCQDSGCPGEAQCVAGVCVPTREASVQVVLDFDQRQQELIGFGASLAYDEEAIADHPESDVLLDLLFADSGFNVVRLRNRFDGDNPGTMSVAGGLLAEAGARIGRKPLVLMTSGSPPVSLKANGERFCSDSDVDCTLSRDAGGGFDYAGFAEHWRASLEAYSAVGLAVDWVSIQNNPDFLPGPDTSLEACRFLPTEGVQSVDLPDGSRVNAEFPGYAEALAAVKAAVPASTKVQFVGPSTGPYMTLPYLDALGAETLAAVVLHFYGIDAQDPDTEQLEALSEAIEEQPLLQTEMQADGFDTAVLIHHALATTNATGYLGFQFVGQSADNNSAVLVTIDDTSFRPLSPYSALWHYARHTDAGWVRIAGESSDPELLAVAFLAPNESAWTVILVNTSEQNQSIALGLPEGRETTAARVYRTVFSGDEAGTALGALQTGDTLQLPPRSMATVTTAAD